MTRARFRVVSLLGAAGLMAGLLVSSQAVAAEDAAAKHVLLISVDGLHQSDLAWYVRTHPASALARLVDRGVEYSNAHTPFPSDSFPGLMALVIRQPEHDLNRLPRLNTIIQSRLRPDGIDAFPANLNGLDVERRQAHQNIASALIHGNADLIPRVERKGPRVKQGT